MRMGKNKYNGIWLKSRTTMELFNNCKISSIGKKRFIGFIFESLLQIIDNIL